MAQEKLHIVTYERSLFDHNLLYLHTRTGLVYAREHSQYKNWFATQSGRVLRWTKRNGLTEQLVCPTQNLHGKTNRTTKNGSRGSGHTYLQIPALTTTIGRTICVHWFVWECWHGTRTQGMQIDHINGDNHDNRLINLQEVTRDENSYRVVIINVMTHARDEKDRPLWNMEFYHNDPLHLLPIFDKYRDLYLPRTRNKALRAEMDKRARLNGILKKSGRNPETIPADELEKLYTIYGFREPNEPHPVDWELTHHCES